MPAHAAPGPSGPAHLPAEPSVPSASPAAVPRALERAWWVPLVFVVVSLVGLALVPLVVTYRARALRRQITDVSEPAQVLVNDIQVALRTELYALAQLSQGPRSDAAERYQQAFRAERRAEVALDPLVRGLGPDAVERFVELRTLAAQWNAEVSREWLRSPLGAVGVGRGSPAEELTAAEVLAAAASLRTLLDQRLIAQREQIEAMEHSDVLLPLALAPLALMSALIVLWVGRRMLLFANEAARGRLALARAVAARAGLVRGVTHDLKNPLGAAVGYAQLLEEGIIGPVSAEQREKIARIRHLVSNALDTISDLLELSRAESGQLRITPTPTDVGRLVQQVVSDYRAAAQAAQLHVSVDAPEGLVMLDTDPARVRQILGNLLSNAIKYTPAGGSVGVRVVATTISSPVDGAVMLRAGEWCAIEVRDTGPGIPEDHREHIFEEFYRLAAAEAAAAGTGIGLAISRRLARLLGGELTVESVVGEGSAFTLWLPRPTPYLPAVRG